MSAAVLEWLSIRLVTGLSPRRRGFVPRLGEEEVLVDEVALGHVYIRVLRFYPVTVIPPKIQTHHLHYTVSRQTYKAWYFSDRASWIDYILITNLMHWLLFIHKILFPSTCFEPQVLIFRRIQLYTCSIWYCHSLWEFLVACRYTVQAVAQCLNHYATPGPSIFIVHKYMLYLCWRSNLFLWDSGTCPLSKALTVRRNECTCWRNK